MECPKCGFEQVDEQIECLKCGIIFSKLVDRDESFDDPEDNDFFEQADDEYEYNDENEEIDFGPSVMDKTAWISLGTGIPLALLLFFTPFLNFILHPLKTLVHELGHTIFAWLSGVPAIPAFDFMEGGGVALYTRSDPNYLIILVLYGLLAYALYLYRHYPPGIVFFSVLTVLYSLYFFTSAHKVIILFMGHGTELVFAGIFLYRALSGWGCVHVAERPLYAGLSFWILFNDIQFAWGIMTEDVERYLYKQGKSYAMNDFVQISEYHLGTTILDPIFTFFLICCLVTPILTYLVFRYRQFLKYALQRVLVPSS